MSLYQVFLSYVPPMITLCISISVSVPILICITLSQSLFLSLFSVSISTIIYIKRFILRNLLTWLQGLASPKFLQQAGRLETQAGFMLQS